MKKLLLFATISFICNIGFSQIKFSDYQPVDMKFIQNNANAYQARVDRKREIRVPEIRGKIENIYNLFKMLKKYCYSDQLVKEIRVESEKLDNLDNLDMADDDIYNNTYKYLLNVNRYFENTYNCK
jgi:hypothetical protein